MTDLKHFLRDLRDRSPDMTHVDAMSVVMSDSRFDNVLISTLLEATREVFAEQPNQQEEPQS